MQDKCTTNCSSANHDILVTNIQSGDILCYSVVLIKGSITDKTNTACSAGKCRMKQLNISSGTVKTSQWPVLNFQFKCLVELGSEENRLIIEYCASALELTVYYQPRKTSLSVIPLYIICDGHDGKFQAPNGTDNSIRSACEKIALGAKLLQTLIAEKLNDCNMGRKTFQLEKDIDPSAPDCVTFHSQLSLERARKMKPHELWEHFGRELMMSSLGSNKRKFLAFLSCTRYKPPSDGTIPHTYAEILSATEAHVALGGGGLALFGSACLYTWANRVEDVASCFLNETKVDSRHFMDDSCYRGTYGSCFSTTLGAALHELGHTFDLGHSAEGIMGRGFDNIDLVFTVQFQNDNEKRYSSTACEHIVKPIFREPSKNTTVCFTRLLQLSYTVSPLTEKMKQKQENINKRVYSRNTGNTHDKISETGRKLHSQNDDYFQKTDSITNKKTLHITDHSNISDCTYWSKSCAALLSYHRWFNDFTDEFCGTLTLDHYRNVLVSPAGIRAVEIRDSSGQILNAWQFLEGNGKSMFAVPSVADTKANQLLVAEDSVGNLLKHPLEIQAAV